MIKHYIFSTLLIFLVACSPAFAVTPVDNAIIGAGNILLNPGFESGSSQWTASGGSFAIATSGSNLLNGKASATWDSNGAAQTLTSGYVTIPNGLKGTNGEFACKIMTPSGTT